MYRHILVPTDGSPLSLKAAKEAAKLAKSQKARITAYYAIAPFRMPATGEALIVTPELYSEKEYTRRMKKVAGEALTEIETEAKNAGVPFKGTSGVADSPSACVLHRKKASSPPRNSINVK